ncbi:MAG: hypothetical protein KGI33_02000 [Thaumarchaeota archaeon]|nr:hypothetical protein [Nitrososphaerota archaeon]
MSQVIEAEYDEFLKDIEEKLQKIDPALAMQAMYYERKFTDVEPHGEIAVQYRKGTDLDAKKFVLGRRYGFEIAARNRELALVGLMTLGTIYEISKDPEVEKITGTVSCASY